MTLTRELRTGIAFMFAVFLVLTAFVWGTQRLVVHAQVVDVEQILCYVDQQGDARDEGTGTFPVFRLNDCGNSSPVTDWCPNIPGDQTEDQFPQCTDPGNGGGGDGDSSSDLSVQKTVSDASPAPSSTVTYTITVHNAGPDAAQNVSVSDLLPSGAAYASDDASGAYAAGSGAWTIGTMASGGDKVLHIVAMVATTSGVVVTNTASIAHSDSSDSNSGNNSATASLTSTADTQGGGTPQCSDGIDNDSDGQIDFPADASCADANDDSEADPSSNNGGGGHHHRSSGSSVNNSGGEVLGAQTEACPMYLTGYIKYGASNDMGEVAKLQAFLNIYEANSLQVTGTYDQATLAAVNAFQRKYAEDVLKPWGLQGVTGYVYYTTQKQINTIYCRFQKDFPLSVGQAEEITYVRAIQPQLHAQGVTGMGAARTANPGATVSAAEPASPAVGSAVAPAASVDENATTTSSASQTAAAANANASSTPGWFGKFVNWLFGR